MRYVLYNFDNISSKKFCVLEVPFAPFVLLSYIPELQISLFSKRA